MKKKFNLTLIIIQYRNYEIYYQLIEILNILIFALLFLS